MKNSIECERIITRSLSIVDEKNRERCVIRCAMEDKKSVGVFLNIYNQKGFPLVSIQVSDDGASISVMDERAGNSVRTSSNSLGHGICVTDENNRVRVSIGQRAGGDGHVELKGENEDVTATL